MKKRIVFLCTGIMILVLTACGDRNNIVENQSSAGTESVAESGAESAPSPDNQSQSSPAQGGGHNYEEGWSGEMEGVKAAVVDALGNNYFPDMAVMPDMLEAQFGITADMYDDYFAEVPMISVNVDTLLIIRAKDDKVKEVEEALNTYRDIQIENALQYPMNIGKVQASRIERIGNYVCFAQLGGDVTDAMESGDEAVILQCQEQNELVIEIISQNIQHE